MTVATPIAAPAVVPEGAGRSHPTGWWGMVALIATEATTFAGLLSSYFYTRSVSGPWPQGGIAPPELRTIVPFTVVLLASSGPLFWAEAAIKHDRIGRVRAALAISFLLGAAFLANQGLEYQKLEFGVRDNAYASLFYAITGLHGLHVVVGLLMNAVVQVKAWTGRLDHRRHLTLSLFSLYWHFVDVVWIFVFGSLYLSVRW